MTGRSLFCPHITFRHSGRLKRESVKGHVSEEDSPSISSSTSGVTEEALTIHSTDGSGEHVRKEIVCEDCEEGGPPPRLNHLWRCLEPRCRRLLCGKLGKNHSHTHFQDFPLHFLQENAANKRIWCNECNIEVFPDYRNRRNPPGVWFPPFGTENDGPRGLYNIGNTCFMNAALQCMAAVAPLNSYILGNNCSYKGKNVANSYLWFLSEMWSGDGAGYGKGVMPSRLLHAVRAAHPIFRGFQQHDTQEFLRLFMDTLAEETRVPHFLLEDAETAKTSDTGSDDGDESMSVDSETESFETCDSGNASEETMSTDNRKGDQEKVKEVKIVLKSVVSSIFDGQIESSAQCLSCKQISSRLEVFQDLSLPIPTREELMSIRTSDRYDTEDARNQPGWVGWFWEWVKSFFWGPSPTLDDCFAAFFSSDELKGKNMYSCEKCQKLRNGVKRCSLQRLPEILCVHLKRFRMYEYSGGMGFSGKVSQYVQFPLEGLDLSPFLNKECSSQVTTYRLQGAICHIGSFLGGHYTAYIRRNDEWYLCDDSRVVQVSPETVEECEAYVLFYQKYDLPDHVREVKQEVLAKWNAADNIESKEQKFHFLSRKWLTRFMWGEEVGPIDNSDVVCPHGYMAPYDFVNLGGTWVPDIVWNCLIERFSGGPDLLHPGECTMCSAAWRKHIKVAADKEKPPRLSDGI